MGILHNSLVRVDAFLVPTEICLRNFSYLIELVPAIASPTSVTPREDTPILGFSSFVFSRAPWIMSVKRVLVIAGSDSSGGAYVPFLYIACREKQNLLGAIL